MRKLRLFGTPIFTVIWVLAIVSIAVAKEDGNGSRFRTSLIGYQEVPAISTPATASLSLEVNSDEVEFTLTYSALEGGPATAAHIHLGQRTANGGVMAFLCGGGGKPACPPAGTPATGTITAANILGPAAQGIVAGSPTAFAEFVRAIRAGVAYANVHNATFAGGEIRGQINDRGRGDDDRDGDDD